MTALTDCKVLEVSTSYLDDVVRIEDDYGRTSLENKTGSTAQANEQV